MNAPLPRANLAGDGVARDGLQAFKAAMRHLASGVTIVTAAAGNERCGLTVTSLISLSVEPPSLLVSIKQGASALPLMRRSGRFAVNILSHEHQALADRFAGRGGVKDAARFASGKWVERPGEPPILDDALAAFTCEVEDLLERFSHTIAIGRVVEARMPAPAVAGALVYWRAAYDSIGSTGRRPTRTRNPPA